MDGCHTAVRPLVAIELVVTDDLDAVLLEHSADEPSGRRAECVLERMVLLHEDRAALAQRGERRGHLAAHVRPADEYHPLGVREVAAQCVGVPQRAEIVDSVELRARDGEPPHHRSRGEQDLIELDLLARGQRRHSGDEIQRGHARPREQLHVVGVPPARLNDQHLLARLVAAQVTLRDRRAVVGRVELAADDRDRALRAAGAQRAGTGRRRDPAADEQMVDASPHRRAGPGMSMPRGAGRWQRRRRRSAGCANERRSPRRRADSRRRRSRSLSAARGSYRRRLGPARSMRRRA